MIDDTGVAVSAFAGSKAFHSAAHVLDPDGHHVDAVCRART
jgi:hypothetical protein